MSTKIFAGGLPWEANDSDLKAAFTHFGEVKDAKVIMDKETGKSRGFGFVTFAKPEDATEAVRVGTLEMDVGGRCRKVSIAAANDRPTGGRPPSDRAHGAPSNVVHINRGSASPPMGREPSYGDGGGGDDRGGGGRNRGKKGQRRTGRSHDDDY